MTTLATYPLRLPKSIKEAAERLSKADGTSLNLFVITAVAQRIAALETAAHFEERASRARARAARGEPSALDALLSRTDGEPPREGDELPEGYVPLAQRAAPAPRRKAKLQATAVKPAGKPRRSAKTRT